MCRPCWSNSATSRTSRTLNTWCPKAGAARPSAQWPRLSTFFWQNGWQRRDRQTEKGRFAVAANRAKALVWPQGQPYRMWAKIARNHQKSRRVQRIICGAYWSEVRHVLRDAPPLWAALGLERVFDNALAGAVF